MTNFCASVPGPVTPDFTAMKVQARASAISSVLAFRVAKMGVSKPVPVGALRKQIEARYIFSDPLTADKRFDAALDFLETGGYIEVKTAGGAVSVRHLKDFHDDTTGDQGILTAEYLDDIDSLFTTDEQARKLVHAAYLLEWAQIRVELDLRQSSDVDKPMSVRPRRMVRYLRDTITAWEASGKAHNLPESFVKAVPKGDITPRKMMDFVVWLEGNNEDLGWAVFGEQKFYWEWLRTKGPPATKPHAGFHHRDGLYFTADLSDMAFRSQFTSIDEDADPDGADKAFYGRSFRGHFAGGKDGKDRPLLYFGAFDSWEPGMLAPSILDKMTERLGRYSLPGKPSFSRMNAVTLYKEIVPRGGLYNIVEWAVTLKQFAALHPGGLKYEAGILEYQEQVTGFADLMGDVRPEPPGDEDGAVPIGTSPNSLTQLESVNRQMLGVEPLDAIRRAADAGQMVYLGDVLHQIMRTPFEWLEMRMRHGLVLDDEVLALIDETVGRLRAKQVLLADPAEDPKATLVAMVKFLFDESILHPNDPDPLAGRVLPAWVGPQATRWTRRLIGFALDLADRNEGAKPDAAQATFALLLTKGLINHDEVAAMKDLGLPDHALEYAAETPEGVFHVRREADGGFAMLGMAGKPLLDKHGNARRVDPGDKDVRLVAYLSPLFDGVRFLRAKFEAFDRQYAYANQLLLNPLMDWYFREQGAAVKALFRRTANDDKQKAGEKDWWIIRSALQTADNISALLFGGDLLTVLRQNGNSERDIKEAFGIDFQAGETLAEAQKRTEGRPVFDRDSVLALKLPSGVNSSSHADFLRVDPNGTGIPAGAFWYFTPIPYNMVRDRNLMRFEDTPMSKFLVRSRGASEKNLLTHDAMVSDRLLGLRGGWTGNMTENVRIMQQLREVGITAEGSAKMSGMSHTSMYALQAMLNGMENTLQIGMPSAEAFLRITSHNLNWLQVMEGRKKGRASGYYSPHKKAVQLQGGMLGFRAFAHELAHAFDAALGLMIYIQHAFTRKEAALRGIPGETGHDIDGLDRLMREKHGRPLTHTDIRQLFLAVYRFAYMDHYAPGPDKSFEDIMTDLGIEQAEFDAEFDRKREEVQGDGPKVYAEAARRALDKVMGDHIAPRITTEMFKQSASADFRSKGGTKAAKKDAVAERILDALATGDHDTVRSLMEDVLLGRVGYGFGHKNPLYWLSGLEMFARLFSAYFDEAAKRQGALIGRERMSTHAFVTEESERMGGATSMQSDPAGLDRAYRLLSQLLNNFTYDQKTQRLSAAGIDMQGLEFNRTPEHIMRNAAETLANRMMDRDGVEGDRFALSPSIRTHPAGTQEPLPLVYYANLRAVEDAGETLLVAGEYPVAIVPTKLGRKVMDALRRHAEGPNPMTLGKLLLSGGLAHDPGELGFLYADVRRFAMRHMGLKSVLDIDRFFARTPDFPADTSQVRTLAMTEELDSADGNSYRPWEHFGEENLLINGVSPPPHVSDLVAPAGMVRPHDDRIIKISEKGDDVSPDGDRLDAVVAAIPDEQILGSHITRDQLAAERAKLRARLEELTVITAEDLYRMFYPKGHDHADAPSALQVQTVVMALSYMGIDPQGGDARRYRIKDRVALPQMVQDRSGDPEVDYIAGFLSALGTGSGKTRIIATLHRVRTEMALRRLSLFLAETTEPVLDPVTGQRKLEYGQLTDEEHMRLYDTSPEYRQIVTSGTMIDITGAAKGVVRGFVKAMGELDMIKGDTGGLQVKIDEEDKVVDHQSGVAVGGPNFRLIRFNQVPNSALLAADGRRNPLFYPRPGDATFIDTYAQITNQDVGFLRRMFPAIYDGKKYDEATSKDQAVRKNTKNWVREIKYAAVDPPANMLKMMFLAGADVVMREEQTLPDGKKTHALRLKPDSRNLEAFADVRVQLSFDEADLAGNVSTLGIDPQSGTGKSQVRQVAGFMRGSGTVSKPVQASKTAMIVREMGRILHQARVLYSTATPFKDGYTIPFLERVLYMINPEAKEIDPTVLAALVRARPRMFRRNMTQMLSGLGVAAFAQLPIRPKEIRIVAMNVDDVDDARMHLWKPFEDKPNEYYMNLVENAQATEVDWDFPRVFAGKNAPKRNTEVEEQIEKTIERRRSLGAARVYNAVEILRPLLTQVALYKKMVANVKEHLEAGRSPIVVIDALGDAFIKRQMAFAAIYGWDNIEERLTLEEYVKEQFTNAMPIWRLRTLSVEQGRVDQEETGDAVVADTGTEEITVRIMRDTLLTGDWLDYLREESKDPNGRVPPGAMDGFNEIETERLNNPVKVVMETGADGKPTPYLMISKRKGSSDYAGRIPLTPAVFEMVAAARDTANKRATGGASSTMMRLTDHGTKVSITGKDITLWPNADGSFEFRVIQSNIRDMVHRDVDAMFAGKRTPLPIVSMQTDTTPVKLRDGSTVPLSSLFRQLSTSGYGVSRDKDGKLQVTPRDHTIDRQQTLDEFNSEKQLFVVATPGSASRGIDMHKTNPDWPDRAMLIYEPGDKGNSVVQMLGRINRGKMYGEKQYIYPASNYAPFMVQQWDILAKLVEIAELSTGNRDMMLGVLPEFVDLDDPESTKAITEALKFTIQDWDMLPSNYGVNVVDAFFTMGLITAPSPTKYDKKGNPLPDQGPTQFEKVEEFVEEADRTEQKKLFKARLAMLPLQAQEAFMGAFMWEYRQAMSRVEERLRAVELPGKVKRLVELPARIDSTGGRQQLYLVEHYHGSRNWFTLDFGELFAPPKEGEDEAQLESRRLYFRRIGENNDPDRYYAIDRNHPVRNIQIYDPATTRYNNVPHYRTHVFKAHGEYEAAPSEQWMTEHQVEAWEFSAPTPGLSDPSGKVYRLDRAEMENVWNQAQAEVGKSMKARSLIYSGNPLAFTPVLGTDLNAARFLTDELKRVSAWTISLGVEGGDRYAADALGRKMLVPSEAAKYVTDHVMPRLQKALRLMDLTDMTTLNDQLAKRKRAIDQETVRERMLGAGRGRHSMWLPDIGVLIRSDTTGGVTFGTKQSLERRYLVPTGRLVDGVAGQRALVQAITTAHEITDDMKLQLISLLFDKIAIVEDGTSAYSRIVQVVGAPHGVDVANPANTLQLGSTQQSQGKLPNPKKKKKAKP